MPIYTKPHAETIEKAPPIDFRSAKGTPLTSYTAKGAMTQAAEQQFTLSGVPPLSFSAKGTALSAYSVTGAMSQASQPTPAQPITPSECGDRTGNLFRNTNTGSSNFSVVVAGDELIITALQTTAGTNVFYLQRIPDEILTDGEYYTISSVQDGSLREMKLQLRNKNGSNVNLPAENTIQYDATYGLFVRVNPFGTSGVTVPEGASAVYSNIMLNIGSTAQPYEPYGYKLTISVSGTTYLLYLSEPLRKIGDYGDKIEASGTTGTAERPITKLVFDGTDRGVYFNTADQNRVVVAKQISAVSGKGICTHLEYNVSGNNKIVVSSSTLYISLAISIVGGNTLDDVNAYFASQYANGTPVCVWYVLASPVTETVTCPTITPASGSNTMSVGTTLAPSSVSITTVGGVAPYNPIQPAFAGTADGGGYKLTFTNAGNSYPISMTAPLRKAGDAADELSSSGTITRAIKELALTGTENWTESGSGQATYYALTLSDAAQSAAAVCTDYSYGAATSEWQFDITGGVLRVNKCSFASLTAFKQSLAARAATSNPVKVWYQLATATTETIIAPEIATAKGENVFTETGTLKPSAVSISVPDLYQSITKIPVGDGTHEALKVYTNDGRMVYDVRADVARQMAKQFDGTAATYKSVMQSFFAMYNANSISSANLTDLCRAWYKGTRDDWNGYTTFSATSGSSSGTRGGDNSGLTCVPSTNDTAGQDDFAGLPLFYPIDVNYEVDADTKDIIITGIDGITSSFDRYDPDKFVGVMQMSAYVWHSEDAVNETFTDGYSAQPVTTADSCWMLPEAVRMDGTVREFVVHPKYMGTVVNGKLKCYSGVTPSAYVISHNTVNSYGKANGNQYSGGSVTLLGFLEIMTRIKYASLTQDGIIQGCVNYNVQSPVAAATTSKQYVLLSATNAAKYIVGSTVLIGTATSTSAPDRGTASAYSVTGQAGTVVTKITDDPDGSANKAVWFENLNAFSATGSGSYASGVTVVSTFAWQNGSCDSVLGNDGSPASPSGGKYPAMIQGIEYSVGIYEVYGDMLMQANPATTDYPLGYYSFFVCKDASKRSTDVTANYTALPAKLPYVKHTNAAWRYIKTMSWSNGIIAPTDCNDGSSTTYTRDAFYFLGTPANKTTRARLCFGLLSADVWCGGLSLSYGNSAPSGASWSVGGRPSCGEAFRG